MQQRISVDLHMCKENSIQTTQYKYFTSLHWSVALRVMLRLEARQLASLLLAACLSHGGFMRPSLRNIFDSQ
eukprot:4549238-Amphidinium_carterae.1